MPFMGIGHVGRNVDMSAFISMMKDQSGASAAEYALILAIVGGAIAIAALALGNAVANSMNRASNCIQDTSTC
jgi:pilus assembly protein Flp/PilA